MSKQLQSETVKQLKDDAIDAKFEPKVTVAEAIALNTFLSEYDPDLTFEKTLDLIGQFSDKCVVCDRYEHICPKDLAQDIQFLKEDIQNAIDSKAREVAKIHQR